MNVPPPDLAGLVGYGRCLGWSLYECPPPGPGRFSGVCEMFRVVSV